MTIQTKLSVVDGSDDRRDRFLLIVEVPFNVCSLILSTSKVVEVDTPVILNLSDVLENRSLILEDAF